MLKAIIFDYDGVIVDSFPTIHEIYQTICQEFGLPCPTDINEFKKAYGYSAKEAKINLGIPEDKRAQEIFFSEVLKKRPPLFPGMKEVLEKFSKQYQLFLITATLTEEAEQKLASYGVRDFFADVLGTPREHFIRKPEQINKVLKENGLDAKEVVYVGDRDIDVDIAKEVGIKNVILTEYGWGFSKEKHPYIPSIKNPSELPEKVELFS